MRVFVGIYVGWGDSGGLQFANLSAGLFLNVAWVHLAEKSSDGKLAKAVAKPRCLRIGVNEGADAACVGERRAVRQHDVASGTEAWERRDACASVRKSRPGGHERCRGDNSGGVGFENRAVNTGCVAEIVGVDDEATHCASLADRIEMNSHPGLFHLWCERAPSRILGETPQFVAIAGRLAQLVRAPALQAGGRRFESCTAHQVFSHALKQLAASGVRCLGWQFSLYPEL